MTGPTQAASVPDADRIAPAEGTTDAVDAVLDDMSRDPSDKVRTGAAWNRHTKPPVLARLAQDPAPQVRAMVAKHHATPDHSLVALIADPVPWVAAQVAARDGLSSAVLAAAAALGVEAAEDMALRDTTTNQVLAVLARHPSGAVRYAVLLRRDLPASIIETLWATVNTEGFEPFDADRLEAFADQTQVPDHIVECLPLRAVRACQPTLLNRFTTAENAPLLLELEPNFDGTVGELVATVASVLELRS